MFTAINPAYLITILFFIACGYYLYICIITFRNNSKSKTRNDYLSAGMCLAICSLCYGLMTITITETLRLVLWAIGFTVGCLFFSRWLLFSSNMITFKYKNTKHVIKAAPVLSVILCLICVFSNDIEFIMTDYGVQFTYNNSVFVMILIAFLVVVVGASLFMYYRWWRESIIKRDRIQALLFIILSASIAPFAFGADFIVPTFTNYTVLPLASLCFLPISMPLFISMRKYNTISITVPNASGYIFDTVTIPTFVLDYNNNIKLENSAVLGFFGRSFIGENIAGIIMSNDKKPDQSFFNDAFTSEKVTVETPHGTRICDVLLSVEKDKYNDTLCKVLLLRDITENERKDDMLQTALEQANVASKAKGDFLSNMSHEIRTPLNAVIGMIHIGMATDDINKMSYCFERADNASKHLLGIINDILDISKIEADKFDLSHGDIDFEKMISNIYHVINVRSEEKKQKLIVNINENVPKFINSDELRLSQVLTNLLTNAVKFTPENGTVTITIENIGESDGQVTLRVEVKDTGIGISKEQQAKLFKSFSQADTNIVKDYGGTGLGLEISKRIVELMGGEIWIESELGKGASFIFTIKATKISIEPHTNLLSGDETNEPGETFLQPEKGRRRLNFREYTLLIAEDVEINREIMSAILEETGVSIEFAENGKSAVSMFKNNPDKYSLILMDINMPEMDGYEASRQIRALDLTRARSIPIIAMTANVFREDIERCIEAGMNDHTGKPIDTDSLFGVLKKYLINPEHNGKARSIVNLAEGIAWNDELLTGNTLVDIQHQRIFAHVSDLVQSCENGSSIAILKSTLEIMVNHTVRHFADEEALQLEYNYPGYEQHRKKHDDFKVTVLELVESYNQNGSSSELSSNVNKIVVSWLVNHIMDEDSRISDHIRSVKSLKASSRISS